MEVLPVGYTGEEVWTRGGSINFCVMLQVSATFAASLVTSPAIGAYLSRAYSDTLVVVLASGVALLDIGFILLAVPESLPEEMRPVSWGAPISWEQADPFAVSTFTAAYLSLQLHIYIHPSPRFPLLRGGRG